jgi:hypothetical protein
VADGTILDGACARRSLSPQVGTKEWDARLTSLQGMSALPALKRINIRDLDLDGFD